MGKWKKSSPRLIARFLGTTSKLKGAEPRKMFGYPCCFAQGNMFTGLHEENWIVRLPEEGRERLVSAYAAEPFEPMKGRPMREYLKLPQEILEDEVLLAETVHESLDYALSLPPKVKKKKT